MRLLQDLCKLSTDKKFSINFLGKRAVIHGSADLGPNLFGQCFQVAWNFHLNCACELMLVVKWEKYSSECPGEAGCRREEGNISLLSEVGRRLACVWGHFFAFSEEHSSSDNYDDNISQQAQFSCEKQDWFVLFWPVSRWQIISIHFRIIRDVASLTISSIFP